MNPDNNINNNELNQDNFNMQSNGINNVPLQNNQSNQAGEVNNNINNTNFDQGQMNNTLYSNINQQNGSNNLIKPPKKINLGLIIGIVAVVVIVGVGIALGSKLLTNKNDNSNIDDNITETGNNDSDINKSEEEIWGGTGDWFAENEKGSKKYYINLPSIRGTAVGTGRLSIETNGVMIYYSGQDDDSPIVDDVSELFPTYFKEFELALSDLYGFLSTDNYNYNILKDESITIADYKMHVFKGNLEFDKDILDDGGRHFKSPFVAYATTLKSNGAYAYWIVFYDSDNDLYEKVEQTLEQLNDDYAYKIAKTFREEQ